MLALDLCRPHCQVFFDDLYEKLHSDKRKDCKSELDYMSVKDNQLIFQCLKCNSIECEKNYNKYCNKELIKRFANTYRFFNGRH